MRQKYLNIGFTIAIAAALLLGLYTIDATNQPEARGSANFGSVTLGSAITDYERIRGVMRTYDGVDYIQDIDVDDVPGSANNGWQVAYNITNWSDETAFTALMAETKIVSPTVISGCSAYGSDFMVRLEGTSGAAASHVATNSTGIGVYAEVQAVYTSTWATAYAVYGELEAATGSEITDSSVFYADLVGSGTFGTVDVLSLKAGDTYNYGINFSPATAMTADIVFQNGTELEEVTDTVLTFSEFLAAEEQTAVVVGAQAIITPTGTYQPLTSVAVVSTSLTTAIQNGTVNGQLLILVNENAADAITIVDGANTKLGGDKVLTGGEGDNVYLMWDGADWLCVGYNDN